MGLWSWFKHKFNIGGVTVRITEVTDPITEPSGTLYGKAVWTGPYETVVQATCKLICETTKGEGSDKKTETSTIGEQAAVVIVLAGKSEPSDFVVPYDFRGWLEKRGGVLGGVGKVAGFLGKALSGPAKEEYFVEVSGSIPGVWGTPSHRVPVRVALAK